MPEPPMILNNDEYDEVAKAIVLTEELGAKVRKLFRNNSDDDVYDISWEVDAAVEALDVFASRWTCLLYTSPSPRDATLSRMPSSA